MKARLAVSTVALLLIGALIIGACSFNEYAQDAEVLENIDDYRTGCEIDADTLMTGYKQYEANRFHVDFGFGTPEPTPTPGPITDSDIALSRLLETVWENGCLTGRADVVGKERATLMGLQDQLNLLAGRIEALEPTATQ